MPTAPYPTIETALTFARTRLNDAIQSINGSVLTDAQPFTTPVVNAAWIWLQEWLVSHGFNTLVKESAPLLIPLITTSATGIQVWIDWTGCFDGTTLQATPALPQDLIQAKDCWEDTGNGYRQMDEFSETLPKIPKKPWLGGFQWQDNKLYFIGATQNIQVIVQYCAYFPAFTDLSVAGAGLQPIRIMRAEDALAWRIAYEVASARGDADAASLASNAEAAAARILTRDVLVQTGVQQTSEYQKMKDPAYSGAVVTQ